MSIQQQIIQSLNESFAPTHILVENESHMHNVPEGAESHFKVELVSDAFSGKRMVQQHQAVYAALSHIMPQIHALALHTWAPEQWQGESAQPSPRCLGGGK